MTVVTFTASGSWVAPAGVTQASVLVVGGGGGGGGNSAGTTSGGGGGGGGVAGGINLTVTPGGTYTVTVGAGGAASVNGQGGDGGTSSFVGPGQSISATGGGGGGDGGQASGGGLRNGRSGGSGGGGGSTSSPAGTGGAGNALMGHNGGAGVAQSTVTARGSGGGGGGAADGAAGTATAGGAGGDGQDQSIVYGVQVGGGGGGGFTGSSTSPATGAPGGFGGGGSGGRNNGGAVAAPVAGTTNRGGGGGGGAQNQQGAAGGSGIVVVNYTPAAPPNVPTSVAAVPTDTTIVLSWAAPSGGGPVASYDVRIDAGTPTTGVVSPYTFTGLAALSTHTVEVRAVGSGGTSAWVAVTVTTLETPAFRADIRVGAHSWTVYATDVADPDVVNVLAGAAFTWAAPDNVGWPPLLHVVDRDTLTLRLFSLDAAEFGDIKRGDLVRFRFTPVGYTTADPLVDFAGRVRDVKVDDRPSELGGAYLQLTAADHTVVLADWTVPGTTLICSSGDTRQTVLDRIATVLDTINTSFPIDWIPGTFGSVLASIPTSALGPLGYLGTVSFGLTIPADGQMTAFDIFATFGANMFPVPNYDPTTGALDPTHPFLITYLSTVGQYDVTAEVDACLIPTSSVEWRRGYTPNVAESGAPGMVGEYWAGKDLGATQPPYLEWNLVRPNMDDFNLGGFTAEAVEPTPWGPYEFTVLGWKDPETVRGWLTIPDRYRTYVTITGMDPVFNPDGLTEVSGMLRGCTFAILEDGRWTVDAGIRRGRGIAATYAGTWNGADPTLTWDAVDPAVTWDTWPG